jgi:deoxycytidylate deaminase
MEDIIFNLEPPYSYCPYCWSHAVSYDHYYRLIVCYSCNDKVKILQKGCKMMVIRKKYTRFLKKKMMDMWFRNNNVSGNYLCSKICSYIK